MSIPDPFGTLRQLPAPEAAPPLQYYSLAALEDKGYAGISRLPVTIRIMLESVLRNVDGEKVLESHVHDLAAWQALAPRENEVPFVVGRILLQDFTGIPLLTDLATLRSRARELNRDPAAIEPLVPVHLVVDHSVQTEFSGTPDALRRNMEVEMRRNHERYQLMKWGMQAFKTFNVIPPGIGICHQINLEHLACGVIEKNGVIYPDTLVGTDSHTTMINGIGVLGWGVGGIEAEAAMLGQPVYQLIPDVVGVELQGELMPGVTATDAVLHIVQILRSAKVVGKLVEYFGEGATTLSAPDRATIANMAPEYGATTGYFSVDEKTLQYYRDTGRTEQQVDLIERYFKAQGLFGARRPGDCDYSQVIVIDLSCIRPSLAGPKRPQDRVDMPDLGHHFDHAFSLDPAQNGYGKPDALLNRRYPVDNGKPGLDDLGHGDILVAAITSCTNTSNPELLITAGLLARNAFARGLKPKPWVKTLFTPGSRSAAIYLEQAGLMSSFEQLGFGVAAYGCGACVGNIGPLDAAIETTVLSNDMVCSAVLSGNRNFEARVHPNLRANFLASPPLVVALALAGTVRTNLQADPLGQDELGNPVYLADIWPSRDEIASYAAVATNPQTYKQVYENMTKDHDLWNAIPSGAGAVYEWPSSTYIAKPDFFGDNASTIAGARALAILGDSITTDHISPAGSIQKDSPAGKWLKARDVPIQDFNTYGARRGHHEVMTRGTFANVRLKNFMVPANSDGTHREGNWTVHQPSGETMTIFDAAERYQQEGTPSLIFAGDEYGSGSSRDWAAKGTRLLGVRAVIARTYERIHRSNLVGMGVLPLQFLSGDSVQSLALDGSERYAIDGIHGDIQPGSRATLTITRKDGTQQLVDLMIRLDTAIEAEYFRHGGILPFMFEQLTAGSQP